MSEETLFTAARRLMRELRICEVHGGLMNIPALQAMNTVEIQLDKDRIKQKMLEDQAEKDLNE